MVMTDGLASALPYALTIGFTAMACHGTCDIQDVVFQLITLTAWEVLDIAWHAWPHTWELGTPIILSGVVEGRAEGPSSTGYISFFSIPPEPTRVTGSCNLAEREVAGTGSKDMQGFSLESVPNSGPERGVGPRNQRALGGHVVFAAPCAFLYLYELTREYGDNDECIAGRLPRLRRNPALSDFRKGTSVSGLG
ncbi:hypothetical protein PAAG_11038 [Paracoccidioides lutzii Pb01]|uniref:Uncharacterized protein n=1 Tax=Paracoccidioides lutzii (strain ATCC MYA-826 / Pb01) TaxID=502779 RepID=A0A0A2VMM7_PARBA|nr:hypothetical protein PAAG_11038 [Paracoccidioides lutzii Pb01]KGQ02089.1 hypothetical protein PAAG_11038 [Paracoccidioides lutzii Pb01]